MCHPLFELPRPLVIAHRGASATAPENTLPAFAAALAEGAAVLESDLRSTADGVPVLIHDATVDRTTDGSGAVASLTHERLRLLDAGARFSGAGGAAAFAGRRLRVPSLAEALSEFPGACFNLELKDEDAEAVGRVVSLVRAAGADRRVLLTAESDATMELLRRAVDELGSGVALGSSRGDVERYLRAAAAGAPPPAGVRVLQIPPEHEGRELATPPLLDHARRHGVHVHLWTINDAGEMDSWLERGVDGLVTDRPGLLAARVAARR